MITNFADRETEKIFSGLISRKIPPAIQPIARRKLRMLNNAHQIQDLRIPPGNHLEQLQGKRKGIDSIRINDQWRICFRYTESEASDVTIIDYHGG